MKWGMQAFDTFKVVPPGIGIVHQVNLEYLARGVHQQGRRLLSGHAGRHRQPHHHDQRHRRGRLGRGRHRGRGRHARPAGLLPHARRGRREPEGQAARRRAPPPTWCSPSPRCCARRRSSASSSSSSAKAPRALAVPDRATIANMAPEYGATMGFFPVDDEDHRVLPGHRPHRRGDRRVRGLLQGAGPVRHARRRATSTTARCSSSTSSTSRPRSPARSARRTASTSASVKATFTELFSKPVAENGFAKKPEDLAQALQDRRRHRHRLGRRADRRDHLLHQHLQPERAARRRAAREEGGRARPDGQAAHQDLARARLARGDRVPDQGAGCCPTWRSSASTSPPTAAPPASATPARSPSRSRRRSSRTTSSARRCSRATAISRRASIPTSAPTSSPRRRWSSPTRSPAPC